MPAQGVIPAHARREARSWRSVPCLAALVPCRLAAARRSLPLPCPSPSLLSPDFLRALVARPRIRDVESMTWLRMAAQTTGCAHHRHTTAAAPAPMPPRSFVTRARTRGLGALACRSRKSHSLRSSRALCLFHSLVYLYPVKSAKDKTPLDKVLASESKAAIAARPHSLLTCINSTRAWEAAQATLNPKP